MNNRLKAMGIDDVLHFDFMDPPEDETICSALKQLYLLEALDDDGKITEVGEMMSVYPLSPELSRVLIESFSNEYFF